MGMRTVVEPKRHIALDWRELFANRELLLFFAWRNFKIRYKQTLVGTAWAVFQPLVLMVIFTVFFHRVVKIGTGSEHIPYPIFSYSGLLFWNYFSQATTQVSNSLLVFQNVISKIYFPRLIAPLSAAITGLIDFVMALGVYVILLLYYQITPGLLGIALFLPMVMLSFITVTGVGLFLAALNIKYRDIQQALPFFIQTLLFVTPVIYPVSLVPEHLRWLVFLNPMAGVIETIRSSLLGLGALNWPHLGISTLSALGLLLLGIVVFKRREREIADYI